MSATTNMGLSQHLSSYVQTFHFPHFEWFTLTRYWYSTIVHIHFMFACLHCSEGHLWPALPRCHNPRLRFVTLGHWPLQWHWQSQHGCCPLQKHHVQTNNINFLRANLSSELHFTIMSKFDLEDVSVQLRHKAMINLLLLLITNHLLVISHTIKADFLSHDSILYLSQQSPGLRQRHWHRMDCQQSPC